MATFGFTRASDQDIFRAEPQYSSPTSSSSSCRALTGHEARQFYEDLVKDEDVAAAKPEKTHRRRRPGRESRRRERAVDLAGGSVGGSGTGGDGERRRELQGLRLLRCAHEGDTTALKDLLSKGADINFQDSYWWTGLMCASWAGHGAAVRLLLRSGAAWVGVVDLQGRDALDLAMEAGHTDVVEEFDDFGTRTERHKSKPTQSAPCPQRCEVCDTSFSGPAPSHLSSTLHQFNLRRPPPTPHYCLPPSSAGYRMMLRSGWDPGSGLGPEGSGARRPVPTVLKRDTQGLGYGHGKRARVTHFKAGDTEAVKAVVERGRGGREGREGRGVRREEARRKEQREKIWERDFRSSFYL